MKVVNKELKFEFVVPDEFNEICRDDYRKYNIDEVSTLHVFFDGRNPISINRDDYVKNDSEFEELVDDNISNMELVGMELISKELLKNRNLKKYYEVKTKFDVNYYNSYFIVINGVMIAYTISNDLEDIGRNIAESIKELK